MRIEIMPLIDVIFLLLTFFIFAMVLMHRVDLLDMQLPTLSAAEPDSPAPAVTISIRQDGALVLEDQAVTIEEILPRVQAAVAEEPRTVVYLAVDERGQSDRLPLFLSVWNELARAGLDIKLFSLPTGGGQAGPGAAGTTPTESATSSGSPDGSSPPTEGGSSPPQ